MKLQLKLENQLADKDPVIIEPITQDIDTSKGFNKAIGKLVALVYNTVSSKSFQAYDLPKFTVLIDDKTTVVFGAKPKDEKEAASFTSKISLSKFKVTWPMFSAMSFYDISTAMTAELTPFLTGKEYESVRLEIVKSFDVNGVFEKTKAVDTVQTVLVAQEARKKAAARTQYFKADAQDAVWDAESIAIREENAKRRSLIAAKKKEAAKLEAAK